MTTFTDHSHEIGLDESFDFINTLDLEAGAPRDKLPTPDAALDWLTAVGALHVEDATDVHRALHDDARRGQRMLGRLRRARAALREVADAVAEGRPADADAIEELNRTLRGRALLVLEPSTDGVRIGHRHEGDPVDDALARLVQPVVREIAEGRPERVRVCANDTCRWVFYDASPTARRRWCDMASCGNRAKAARHRARLRERAAATGARVSRARGSAGPPSRAG